MTHTLTKTSLGGLPIQLDPNARDFESIRQYLLELVPTLTPEWTDFSGADPGVTILEAVATLVDALHYQVDRAQNESYLLTAQQRQNVIEICRLIDYELPPGASASVNIEVVTSGPQVLPAGWGATSDATPLTPPLRFELLSSVNIPSAGTWRTADIPDLVLVHGTTVADEVLGTSSGVAKQRLALAQAPLALNPDGSAPIAIRVGVDPWVLVSRFIDSGPSDKVFRFVTDQNGLAEILFGDGVNGEIPATGQTIRATYRVGGGRVGNSVGIGAVKNPLISLTNVVSVVNYEQPSGGADPQSIQAAKVLAPLSLRALDRAVELGDYETLARQVGGVRGARAVHLGGSPFQVGLYVSAAGDNPVPSGRWYPELDAGTGLLGQVGRYMAPRRSTPYLAVMGAQLVRPYLSGQVFALPNYLRSDVNREVSVGLIEFFRDRSYTFGRALPLSDIIRVIENARGVDYVNIEAFHRLPVARFVRGYEQAFDVGSLSVTGVGKGASPDQYEVVWLNHALYYLRAKLGGVLTDEDGVRRVFTAGAVHEVVRYTGSSLPTEPQVVPQFSIMASTGVPTPNAGDVWTFGLDRRVGNIDTAPYEVVMPEILDETNISAAHVALRYGGGIG